MVNTRIYEKSRPYIYGWGGGAEAYENNAKIKRIKTQHLIRFNFFG